MTKYVIYTRVSSKSQGESRLGLEGQVRDIELFLSTYAHDPEIIGRFEEVHTGSDDDRPELSKALAMARATGAELLVAKLDRLSRRVSFVAKIMDDKKVRLRVATMPHADNFQLHIYAALAEQEREFISRRTIAALAAAKARGVRLGGYRDKTCQRNIATMEAADARAAKLIKIVGPMREAGRTLTDIADTLADMSIPTARGGKWTAVQVSHILQRANPEVARAESSCA